MKAYYYSFLIKKIEVFFQKFEIFEKNIYFFDVKFFWKFLCSANIMFDFNKWGLKWNDRIPTICFSKKKNQIFFKFYFDENEKNNDSMQHSRHYTDCQHIN